MKVTIITACWNNEDTIESSLDSLKNQDYKNIEHIIKDGGSTDRTLEIISKHAVYSILISETDGGMYEALNVGMSKASGDVIGILHSDDLFASNDVISAVVKLFDDTNCDAVYGDLNYIDRTDPDKIKRKWISGFYKEGSFLHGWMPPHPTFFVKRSVVEAYGGYNTTFKTAADYEWMLRLIHKHKIKIAYVPRVLVSMRIGGQSNITLKNRVLANLEDRKAWKINDLMPKWYTLWLKPWRKVVQWL